MDVLSYSNEQLQATVRGLEMLAEAVPPKRAAFVAACEQFGWLLRSADHIVIEFNTPCASPFVVDLYNGDLIAGGFVALCLLEWDELEGTSADSQKSRDLFDAKFIETVTVTEQLLGKADSMIAGSQPCQQYAVWRKQHAFIFVLQGADDYEGIDVRLWLEYFDGNDALPDSQIFDWLCQRHLSKIKFAD